MSDNPRCGFFVGTFAAALAGTMAMAADWPFAQAVLPIEIVETVELAGLDERLLLRNWSSCPGVADRSTVTDTLPNHRAW
ncbi:MAG: hypothetical protein QGI75_01100 [Phycisphaerales bacterium]|nr:hypothetical protein [Phycisphaerales bacterium]